MFISELKKLCSNLKGIVPNDSSYLLEENKGLFRFLNTKDNWYLLFKFNEGEGKLNCTKLVDKNEKLFVSDGSFYKDVAGILTDFLFSISGKEPVLEGVFFNLNFDENNVKLVGDHLKAL